MMMTKTLTEQLPRPVSISQPRLWRGTLELKQHIPDTSPGPTGTSCLGYPRGTWPPLTSSFCANPSRDNERHQDCSLPGCTCPCHAHWVKAGTPHAATRSELQRALSRWEVRKRRN